MPSFSVMQLTTDTGDPAVARMAIFGDIRKGDIFELITGTRDESRTEALDVVGAIQKLPPTTRSIEVHINSYGGDVAEGVAIYNALRESGRDVTTVCDGFACSIASVVFMAGRRRVMRPASLLMLHNPWVSKVGGNASQLRKAADDLDVITQLSRTAYLNGTHMDADELTRVMDAETWVTPEQALAWGLATEVEDASDEDAGSPSQHVGAAVMQALAGSEGHRIVTEARIGGEQVAEIARAVAAELAARQAAGNAKATNAGQKDGFAALASRIHKNKD